jgi:hypothetical protein
LAAGDTGGLASGGNHLCTGQPHQRQRPPLRRATPASGGDHLCNGQPPPVEATTSTPASGGDHLCNGQPPPAEAATSAPMAYRRRRTPQRVQKGPRPPSFCGGEDKTIQERDRHLHGVRRFVQPLGRRRNSVAGGAGDATGATDLHTA